MESSHFRTSPLITIPVDVTLHHIFSYLQQTSLISCSLSCSFLNKVYTRFARSAICKKQKADILREIFREGSMNLLLWFQQFLKYPSLDDMRSQPSFMLECASNAAEGKNDQNNILSS